MTLVASSAAVESLSVKHLWSDAKAFQLLSPESLVPDMGYDNRGLSRKHCRLRRAGSSMVDDSLAAWEDPAVWRDVNVMDGRCRLESALLPSWRLNNDPAAGDGGCLGQEPRCLLLRRDVPRQQAAKSRVNRRIAA